MKHLPWIIPFVAFFIYPYASFQALTGKYLAVYASGLGAAALFLGSPFALPRFSKKVLAGAGLLLFLMLANLLSLRPADWLFPLLDRLSFFLIALAAWKGFRLGTLSWKDFYLPVAVALTGVSAYGILQVAYFGFAVPFHFIGSTFGYANNAAQFVGLALLFFWAMPKPKAAHQATYLVSFLALAYLALARNRSGYLSLSVASLALLWVTGAYQRLAWKKIGAGGALLVCLLFGLQLAKGQSLSSIAAFDIVLKKGDGATPRLDIWRSTIHMIQDHPWRGVGPDGFAFPFSSYMSGAADTGDRALTISPHNELLRYAAEDGIPLTILYALAWIFLFVAWRKKSGPEDRAVVTGTGVFLLAESAVQFPVQNPAPLLVLAILAGLMAARVWPEKLTQLLWLRMAAGVAALGFALLAGRAWISRTFENSSQLHRLGLACEIAAGNWQACLSYAHQAAAVGRFELARGVVEQVIRYEPQNFSAVLGMANIASIQGNKFEACFYAWKYDDFFRGNSSMHDLYMADCSPKLREYFKRKRPNRYYGLHEPTLEADPLPGALHLKPFLKIKH